MSEARDLPAPREGPRAHGLSYADVREAPRPTRRTSGFHRVTCHKCGRATVVSGTRGGTGGEGHVCSACAGRH